LGNRTTYSFDAAGRLTLRIDGRGQRITYVYDTADRPTGRRYADATRVTLVHDAVSHRTVLNDSTGRTSSTYDAAGRLTQVVNPAGLRLTYAYDALGQRSYLIEPEGLRFTYVYDVAGRISRLTNPQSQITTWSYDSASRVTGIRLANATRASYAYDDADRLLRLANLGTAGATLSSFRYTYDGVGNRTRVVEANGDRVTWSYDNTYQLTREWRSGTNSYAITYTYDPVGNRLTKHDATVPTTYAYDAANQVKRVQDSTGYTTYTYDGNGNLSLTQSPTNQRMTYSWDGESRLTQVSLPSSTVDLFVYNGDGQRVQKQDSGGTTKFIWDEENVLVETNTSNVIQAVYCLEPVTFGNLMSQRRGTTTSLYHFDGLGSTDRLSDINGTVTDSYLYQAFGKLQASVGSTTNQFHYAGKSGYYHDFDTDYLYLRTRYYSASLGRFVSRDDDRTNIFLYMYSYNNPVSFLDPSGHSIMSSEFDMTSAGKTPTLTHAGSAPPPPNPKPGTCLVKLCCRSVQLGFGISPCHCFILTRNSIGQQVYYSSGPGGYRGAWRCRCSEAYGEIQGFVGGFGSGYEDGKKPLNCKVLGSAPCQTVQNCLQSVIDWFNRDPYICYSLTGPNSNTVAYTLINTCVGVPPVPPTGVCYSRPIGPGVAPGYGPLSQYPVIYSL